MCACQIIWGHVSHAEKDAPEEFGNLSRSVISMFRIASGETWAETIPTVSESDDGSKKVNWKVSYWVYVYET